MKKKCSDCTGERKNAKFPMKGSCRPKPCGKKKGVSEVFMRNKCSNCQYWNTKREPAGHILYYCNLRSEYKNSIDYCEEHKPITSTLNNLNDIKYRFDDLERLVANGE